MSVRAGRGIRIGAGFVLVATAPLGVLAQSPASAAEGPAPSLSTEQPADLPPGAALRIGKAASDAPDEAHTNPASIRGVALSRDGRLLATRDEPGDPEVPRAVRLWDTATGRLLHVLTGHDRPIADFALSPDGRTLVSTDFEDSGDQGGLTRIWDVTTGQSRHVIPEGGPAVAFSSDGSTFALVVRDQVRIYRTATGEEIQRFTGPNVGYDLSGDGHRVLARSFSRDPVLRVFDVAAGRELAEFTSFRAPARTAVLAPDGRTIAADDGHAILLCEVETSAVIHRLQGHTARVFALAFSPDGRFLASGALDGSVRLWEIATGRELYHADGHRGLVTALAFSHEGDRLVSGSTDRTAIVWDLTGKARSTVPADAIDEKSLETVWHDLAAPDPSTAYLAIARIVTAHETGLPRLRDQLLSILIPAQDERIQRLLRNLAHQDSRVRQRAMRELRKLRQIARPQLDELLAETGSPEVRNRLLRILGGASDTPRFTPGDERRMVRVLSAMEQLGGPEAEQVVELIVREFPPERVVRDARATLERMRSR